MDDIVRQAMAKWPQVPHCYGWLGLDARGHWYMRDDRTQAAGHFASGLPHAKGSLLQHEKLIDFIGRNYLCDDAGQWYFQNGPQRVFVELQATPWIWRIASDGSLTTHTGQAAQYRRCLVDEQGHAYLEAQLTDPNTPDGPVTTAFGLVHTLDVAQVADALAQGQWDVESVLSSELPARYGYVPSPQKRLADSLSKK